MKQSLVCSTIQHLYVEMVSWITKIWMEIHLVSDNNCNIVNLYCPIFSLQGMTNNVRLNLVLVTLHVRLTFLYRARQLVLMTLNTIFSVANSYG